MKILIIEDEKELRKSMVIYLSSEGHIVETAGTFDEALEKLPIYTYDIFIVDINIPGGTGLELIKYIKKEKIQGGVIIVSANSSLENRIEGLEIGSDDYLTKPFHLSELNARIKSIFRRNNFNGQTNIEFNEIEINPDSRQIFVNKNEVHLTGKEYDLILFFLSNKNRVVSKDSIAEHLWGDHIDQSENFDFLYTHIKNLKKKLVKAGCNDYIQSVYGIGYKFTT